MNVTPEERAAMEEEAARFEHGERPGLPLGWEDIDPVVGTPEEDRGTEDSEADAA